MTKNTIEICESLFTIGAQIVEVRVYVEFEYGVNYAPIFGAYAIGKENEDLFFKDGEPVECVSIIEMNKRGIKEINVTELATKAFFESNVFQEYFQLDNEWLGEDFLVEPDDGLDISLDTIINRNLSKNEEWNKEFVMLAEKEVNVEHDGYDFPCYVEMYTKRPPIKTQE